MSACTCGSDSLVQVDLAPTGRQIRFSVCRDCERRWWNDLADADVLVLDDVLSLVGGSS
ncbi:MAG TPA: hypothetical protein VG452_07465 [Egibacteraceae bacterium]|nr:hypothetical protein [Egibacteraceae bacterium]